MNNAVHRAMHLMDLRFRPENLVAESFGNLHKAMNLLRVAEDGCKVGGDKAFDDYEFQFFHSLGKFLYNKSERYVGIDKQGKIRAMLKHEMVNDGNRPGMYFSPEDIINRAPCQPSLFWVYLEQNFLDFYEEIGDVSNTLDYFQVADLIDAQKLKDNYPLSEYIPSYIAGRAILSCNNSPAPRRFFNIAAPTVLSFSRRLDDNKQRVLALQTKPYNISWNTFITEVHGYTTRNINKILQEEAEENELWDEITVSMDNIRV